jgi:predicted nucleotide-binding protein
MKLNLEPIILHEQSNLVDTIIERLEHTSPMAFSIVLITLDGKACPIIDPSVLKSRARQSVVFELGFFIGRFGREKVWLFIPRVLSCLQILMELYTYLLVQL